MGRGERVSSDSWGRWRVHKADDPDGYSFSHLLADLVHYHHYSVLSPTLLSTRHYGVSPLCFLALFPPPHCSCGASALSSTHFPHFQGKVPGRRTDPDPAAARTCLQLCCVREMGAASHYIRIESLWRAARRPHNASLENLRSCLRRHVSSIKTNHLVPLLISNPLTRSTQSKHNPHPRSSLATPSYTLSPPPPPN